MTPQTEIRGFWPAYKGGSAPRLPPVAFATKTGRAHTDTKAPARVIKYLSVVTEASNAELATALKLTVARVKKATQWLTREGHITSRFGVRDGTFYVCRIYRLVETK